MDKYEQVLEAFEKTQLISDALRGAEANIRLVYQILSRDLRIANYGEDTQEYGDALEILSVVHGTAMMLFSCYTTLDESSHNVRLALDENAVTDDESIH